MPEKVALIGSGNWGSAIATKIGKNVQIYGSINVPDLVEIGDDVIIESTDGVGQIVQCNAKEEIAYAWERTYLDNPWDSPEHAHVCGEYTAYGCLALGACCSALKLSLRKLAQDLQRPNPPALAADRRKCTLCCWRGVCGAEASAQGHLSEVSGIGAKRREMLIELGVHGLADLAGADPDWLASRMERFGDQHGEVARALVLQARAQRDNRVTRLTASPALSELVQAPGILLYDIESDPDARDDFLHGFLPLSRGADGRFQRPDGRKRDVSHGGLRVISRHLINGCAPWLPRF